MTTVGRVTEGYAVERQRHDRSDEDVEKLHPCTPWQLPVRQVNTTRRIEQIPLTDATVFQCIQECLSSSPNLLTEPSCWSSRIRLR
jgi:hypothetical protein